MMAIILQRKQRLLLAAFVAAWSFLLQDATAFISLREERAAGIRHRSTPTRIIGRGCGSIAPIGTDRNCIPSSPLLQLTPQDGRDTELTHTPDNDATTKESWSWLVRLVLPLWLVYVSNQWSRSSLYYLVNFDTASDDSAAALTAMNVALQFDQAQYGILASLAFTTLFAVASLGAGYAADRFNRRTLTLVSVVGWTLATIGTARADSYETVLACRVAMGLACAVSTPTAYTWIRDLVPASRQATASSLYGTGVAMGSALASLTLLLDTAYGWRDALTAISAAGLSATCVALLVLPNDDPVSDRPWRAQSSSSSSSSSSSTDSVSSTESTNSLWTDVQESVASRRAQWIYMASLLRFSAGLCIGVWGAPYFRMAFSDHISDYAVLQAVISAVGASASGILGGALADQLSSSSSSSSFATVQSDTVEGSIVGSDMAAPLDLMGRRLWVPVVGSILAVPTWYMCLHSDSFEAAMAWLAVEYFVAECWFGPTISTLQATVGPRIGGTAQGLFTLSGAVANLSPTLLGLLYSQAVVSSTMVSSSSTELSNLLSSAVCIAYLSSAICFVMAARASPLVLNMDEPGREK